MDNDSLPTEDEMSTFINSEIPKGTLKNTNWENHIFQSWAKKKGIQPDIKCIDENALSDTLRMFYHGLRNNQGKLYPPVSLRGIRAGLQRFLKSSPNPKNINIMSGDLFKAANAMLDAKSSAYVREPYACKPQKKVSISDDDMIIII